MPGGGGEVLQGGLADTVQTSDGGDLSVDHGEGMYLEGRERRGFI